MSHQRHRGQHPADQDLFRDTHLEAMRMALRDLCWLLSRGYARTAAVALVGDRYQLRKRQRLALSRAACTDEQRASRKKHRVSAADCGGKHVAIDGFNCIITFEAMWAGGAIFVGQDGVRRDLSSVHGTYRQVQETITAIEAIAAVLQSADKVTWFLDRPISNSGRLAERLREHAQLQQLSWHVEVVNSPDHELAKLTDVIVASSDSWVMDQASAWVDLAENFEADSLWLIDLRSRG